MKEIPLCSCCKQPMDPITPVYWICRCDKPWFDPVRKRFFGRK